jgi:hypothetical protein
MKPHLFFVVLVLLIVPRLAAAGPKLLSDEEMDEITAQGGGVQLDFGFNAETGDLNFNFNLGPTLGNGSVVSSPASTSGPSNLTLTGNTNLSNSTFVVENMILNLNVCAMCNATVINQLGLGLGITLNPQQ